MTIAKLLALSWMAIPLHALQESKLVASDGAPHDSFGYAVALSGNRALVTAVHDDDMGESSGSAYVFERGGSGTWTQVAKLLASDGKAADNFGRAAALYGDRALVAADFAGVYVFERDAGGSWNQVQKLQPADGLFSTWVSLSLWDDWALVGDSAQDSRGRAFVFYRGTDGQWAQVREFSASDAELNDDFGESVAFSGRPELRALVGAPDKNFSQGGVYLYERTSPGIWEERIFQTNNPTDQFTLGYSVAISGDRALAGAFFAKPGLLALVFEPDSSGQWVEVAKLVATDGAAEGTRQQSVALWGDRALVGTREERATYVFERAPDGAWSQTSKLVPSDANGNYQSFGQPTSLRSGAALVGAPDDEEQGLGAGAAYVFDQFVGTKYCDSTDNSSGHPAELLGTGTASLTTNDLVLSAGPVPNQFGVFFVGGTRIENAFGNGVLCAGAPVIRLAPIQATAGEFVQAIDFNSLPLYDRLLPGQAWHFQLWFRDPAAGGALFNLSSALAITIEP